MAFPIYKIREDDLVYLLLQYMTQGEILAVLELERPDETGLVHETQDEIRAFSIREDGTLRITEDEDA